MYNGGLGALLPEAEKIFTSWEPKKHAIDAMHWYILVFFRHGTFQVGRTSFFVEVLFWLILKADFANYIYNYIFEKRHSNSLVSIPSLYFVKKIKEK